MNEKRVVYSINGEDYILVEVPVSDKEDQKKMAKRAEEAEGIYQGFELVKGGFWDATLFKLSFLIPFKNIHKFQKD